MKGRSPSTVRRLLSPAGAGGAVSAGSPGSSGSSGGGVAAPAASRGAAESTTSTMYPVAVRWPKGTVTRAPGRARSRQASGMA